MKLRIVATLLGAACLVLLTSATLAREPEPWDAASPETDRMTLPGGQPADAEPWGFSPEPETRAGGEGPLGPASVTIGDPGRSYRYLRTLGETEVPYFEDGYHLNRPRGVAIDKDDSVYISEWEGHRVLKFDDDGNFQAQIGYTGLCRSWDEADSGLCYPTGLAVDDEGHAWIAERWPHRVSVFSDTGEYEGQLGVSSRSGSDNDHFNQPRDVAFDADGRIYVADAANDRVQIFHSTGTYSTTVGGTCGTGNYQFCDPLGVAIDEDGTLYVADEGNHRVQVYALSGGSMVYSYTLGTSGVCGSANTHFCYPADVTVDGSAIYVADRANSRVQRFAPTGVYSDTLPGNCGSGNGYDEFCGTSAVEVDSNGNIYVVPTAWLEEFRVQVYDSDFNYVRTLGTWQVPYETDTSHYNAPTGLAVDDSGNIIVAEESGRRLLKLNPSGILQWSVGTAGVGGSDSNHLAWGAAAAVDGVGTVYVADTDNHRVEIFSAGGGYLYTLGGSRGTGAYQFQWPRGVAVDSSGWIYVADTGNHRLQIYDASRAYKYTLGGTCGTGDYQLCQPYGVAVDQAGNIYVADTANHRVQVYDSSRVYQDTIGVTGACDEAFDHLCGPVDVAVDDDGNIFVADSWNNRVQVFDSTLAYRTTIGGDCCTSTGQLRDPEGLDLDSAGNLYVADKRNHRIQEFAPGVPYWTQVNINGFGDLANVSVDSLATFGGILYAGTGNDNGTQVWRKGSAWEQVNTNGFGNTYNVAVNHMIDFDGYLYAGTWADETNGCEVWRTNSGTAWARVASGGFGDPTNGEVFRFAVFDETLYASTWSYTDTHGTEVYSTTNGTSWTEAVDDGFGDANNEAALCFEEFGGYLYSGTYNSSTGGEVWRSTDGASWSQVNTDGFGDSENFAVTALSTFKGYLYASIARVAGAGAEIWRCQDCDNTDWAQVVDDGFGDSDTRVMPALEVLDDLLVMVVGNIDTGMEVWRTGNGTTWEQIGFAGFGDSNNRAPYWDNPVVVLDDWLYVGTWNYANGGEIWKMWMPFYVPLTLKAF